MPSLLKLIPTVLVAGVLLAGMIARPPRSAISPREMTRLVIAISVLYLSGGAALLGHRTGLAAIVFGLGLTLCGLTLWLSRGAEPPPEAEDRDDEPPAPPPAPREFLWSYYEDQFRDRLPERSQAAATRSSSQA